MISTIIGQYESTNLQRSISRILQEKEFPQNFELTIFNDHYILKTEHGTIILNIIMKYGSAYAISEMIVAACKEWEKLNS